MVRNANRFRHSVIRLRRSGIRLRYSVTILRRECQRRAVAGVVSAAVAAPIASAVAEACAAPVAAIVSVAAHTVAATAGDSDEGVDRRRVASANDTSRTPPKPLGVVPRSGQLSLEDVGMQWELPGAVARRDQSHTVGFLLYPAP